MSLSATAPDIVVIGSANMDLVARAAQLPRPGETVLGGDFHTVPGGKGANQAVAAARLGARTAFVGCTGDDPFGHTLRSALAAAGVDLSHARIVPDTPTGVALIIVSAAGENAICVAPGANGHLSPADIDTAAPLLAAARIVVLQLEIPLPTAAYAARRACELGAIVILDPAPATANLPPELLDVDILTPNESEAAIILGRTPAQSGSDDPAAIARELRSRGPRAVVLKLGAAGCFYSDTHGEGHWPAHAVPVVDTTAAGDAFTAALAASHARDPLVRDPLVRESLLAPLASAARYANAAGAIACTRHGAQPSMPTSAEVEQLLEREPPSLSARG